MRLAYLLATTGLRTGFHNPLLLPTNASHHANGCLALLPTPSRFFPLTFLAQTNLGTCFIHSPESHQREGRNRVRRGETDQRRHV